MLARVPRARLAFSPLRTRAASRCTSRLAAAGGIDAGRLRVRAAGCATTRQNQARYRLVDFVLDPMPFGGVNGTLEALDMGVPVVTLVGQAARRAHVVFHPAPTLALSQTVAASGSEYVEIAVRLATDAAFMREVRARNSRGLAQARR